MRRWYGVGAMGLLWLLFVAACVVSAAAAGAVVYSLRHPPRMSYARALGRGLETDPAALGLEYESATFRLSDGSPSPGWRLVGRRGDGPVVVVVHGWGNGRYGMLGQCGELADFASQVVVFDLPGQGESPVGRSTAGEREVDDVLAVVSEVGVDRPVVLAGYSMGATVAMGAGVLGGGRIAGVVAEGPYRLWSDAVRGTLRRRGYPHWPIVWLAGLLVAVWMPRVAKADGVALAGALPGRLLVLHGTEDWLCPVSSARQMAEAAGDRGRLVLFAGAGHEGLWAYDARLYRRSLEAFFKAVEADVSGGCG